MICVTSVIARSAQRDEAISAVMLLWRRLLRFARNDAEIREGPMKAIRHLIAVATLLTLSAPATAQAPTSSPSWCSARRRSGRSCRR